MLNTARMETTLEIANALGRANMAKVLGVGMTTISAAVSDGMFPASWYLTIKALGAKQGVKVPDELFRFKGEAA